MPFLIYENGTSYTKSEFDAAALIYSRQLIDAGYDRTCRIGIRSDFSNLIKMHGIINVCSVVVFDQNATDFEIGLYGDIDIWDDVLPKPRFNQCSTEERYAFCSSGSTDKPRFIPWHQYEIDADGLEYHLKKYVTDQDVTWNILPLWASIGVQVFNVCYEMNATYYVAEDTNNWIHLNPTFMVGSPLVLRRVIKQKEKCNPFKMVWSISGTLTKQDKDSMREFFGVDTWDYYGLNEIGGCSMMTHPQKYESVGVPLEGKNIEIIDGEIVINDFETGDMGYFDEDGFLFITGRKKDVINLGGPKIMPYEVERALIKCGADECIVFGETSVHALVVGDVNTDELTRILAKYKHPKIHYVDELPTKIGKVNRNSLLHKYIHN